MLPPLVVFWLAGPAVHGAPLVVEEWAAGRGYRPVVAAESSQPVYDESLVREVEALLEEARSVAGRVDIFERIDQLIATHAELPQASFWMAERYALDAQYRARGAERDLEAERELERRGNELEGGRATAVGAASSPAAAAERERLELLDLRPQDEVLLDGSDVRAGASVAAGRHHVQLFRAQRRVWAGWVELGSPAQLRVPDPTPACSALDLMGTERGAQGPVAAAGVRCDAWAVAHVLGSQLELSFCRGSQCSPWERRARAAEPWPSADARMPQPGLSPWVTWGALGLGAAASTLLVLWGAGAFERTPSATEFVFTGPTAAALRF